MSREVLGERYEVQQQLGKKSGRRTLLARDLVTGDLVIVKLLAFGSDFEWDDLKLFEREAQTLKSLSHPSIPRYLDYFEVNSPNYQGFALIQTHIPATTLEQYLQTGRTFTEVEVKEIAASVLEILIYLHGLNPPVIHRDIKPSNILLGERSGNSVGKVYLVDFGSVQTILAAETGTRTVVGTYGYMPQEQFGGRTVPASDLYSLGATLIYLVTGTHPADLPHKNFRIQFEQLASLSPSLTNWLKRMIEPDLEKRFASATEALQALEQPQDTDIALTVDKPAGSKIKLTKNDEFLEIAVPAVGFDGSMVFATLFSVAWNLFIYLWSTSGISITFPGNFPFILFALPFWGIGLWMIYGVVYCIFGQLKIRIDQKQIAISHQFWKLQIPRRSSPRININKIIYNPKYFTIDGDGDKIQRPPKLVIWSGVKKFEFNVDNISIKSQPELEWIANELSDWLGIPLETE
ncbi:serine/threonine protein kinase [Sphaerospermopsis aphanizomenoides BCCUSP55]|uniref:serine/threonine protein kinase n=1 Tax=Sphaerospermopsis aphanizomenoides TaxID=459663 RepID=UPI0019068493|nr:serine/threonine-protein kinase [Sphaerospermopsis aphanizomenoides]MBK1986666.1 serine/threonine protein kinase [Sphaerospermopsis aphanizomenoides BCCUSP55]